MPKLTPVPIPLQLPWSFRDEDGAAFSRRDSRRPTVVQPFLAELRPAAEARGMIGVRGAAEFRRAVELCPARVPVPRLPAGVQRFGRGAMFLVIILVIYWNLLGISEPLS